jgi:hypothetical protein
MGLGCTSVGALCNVYIVGWITVRYPGKKTLFQYFPPAKYMNFFFKNEPKALSFRLIKKKRVIQLINGKPD